MAIGQQVYRHKHAREHAMQQKGLPIAHGIGPLGKLCDLVPEAAMLCAQPQVVQRGKCARLPTQTFEYTLNNG